MKNAIGIQMASQLIEALNEISRNGKSRVLVITAQGQEAFSIGTDPAEYKASEEDAALLRGISIASAVEEVGHPTIAAINGDVLGQGLELALACDLRIVAETSHFGVPHLMDGLIPLDGGTQRLPRLVGKGKAMEMILTGENIDALEAYRIGLVSKVVPPSELMKVVMDLAQEMASRAPIASRYAKEAINKGMDLTLEQGLRLEADLYFLLHTTGDREEGIKAFQEKRPPRFEGR
jgi:enoyl-CoA hydratase/carnithine racemase